MCPLKVIEPIGLFFFYIGLMDIVVCSFLYCFKLDLYLKFKLYFQSGANENAISVLFSVAISKRIYLIADHIFVVN